MIITRKKWIVIILFDLIMFVISFFYPDTMIIVLVMILWSNGLIYTLENLEKRGALFAFWVSFFLILVGREALEVFGLHEVEADFTSELNRQAEWMVLMSLVFLFLGYAITDKRTFRINKKVDYNYNSSEYITIRKVSSILFYLTFAFNIFTEIDIILFVFRHGYITYYTSFVSSVPYVIKKIGDMCVVCFWIFLATMPDKKRVNKLSRFYIIYLLLTLATGKRFPFVAGLLTLFVYYIARNKINNGGKIWVKKRTLILLCIFTPLLVMSLYIIGQIRVGSMMDSIRIDKIISSFLYNQGVSINVIKRAQLYHDRLPDGKFYLFGSTFEAIANNVISRQLGFTQFAGNTVEHALNGVSFQHALSYVTMGNYYLAGHGLGSCYIAEAFHDLGYFGVAAVNFVYGIIFRKLFNFKCHGIWGTTIILSMLYSLLLAPRGSADGFITDIVDLTTWGTILIVWFFSQMLHSRSYYTLDSSSGSGVQ